MRCNLFFFMIRGPPSSTLFPYTTLFRSPRIVSAVRGEELSRLGEGIRQRPVPPMARRALDVDRKSTRLNSSHSQISYAVFCLKKKTIALIENTLQAAMDQTPRV